MICPHCKSTHIKKNGHTHYGKQNYYCLVCCRQFVEGGQDWFVSDSDRELIDKLLLERISLRGICRVVGISEVWLLNYLKGLYSNLPDDLIDDSVLPDIESYLQDRFDEEIGRIEVKKKDKISLESYKEVFDNQSLMDDLQEIDIPLDGIFEGNQADILLDELYAKERSARVECFGIQLDEMWSFVQNKDNKQWIWLALNPENRQIVAFHVGGRGTEDAQIFFDKIPEIFRNDAAFFSDYWQPYQAVIPQEKHFAVGKDSGLTAYMERFNGTMRQRVSRLVRSALSFSKSVENHIGAIKYFICNYNLTRKALHI